MGEHPSGSVFRSALASEAVGLVKSGEASVTQAAKDPGIALESLRKWIKAALTA